MNTSSNEQEPLENPSKSYPITLVNVSLCAIPLIIAIALLFGNLSGDGLIWGIGSLMLAVMLVAFTFGRTRSRRPSLKAQVISRALYGDRID